MATKKKASTVQATTDDNTSSEVSWDAPFAAEGDRAGISLNASTAGDVNWKQGYTNRYSLAVSEGGKYIERTTFNQIIYMITSKILWFKRAIEASGQPLKENLTWKVGTKGDFQTLSAALEKACEYHPTITGGSKISILLQADYILNEPLVLKNLDLSYVEIGMDENVTEIKLDNTTNQTIAYLNNAYFNLENSFLNFGKIKFSIISGDSTNSIRNLFRLTKNSFLKADSIEISSNQVFSECLIAENSAISVGFLIINQMGNRAVYLENSKITAESIVLKAENFSNIDESAIYAKYSTLILTGIETLNVLQIFKITNCEMNLTYIITPEILQLIDAETSIIKILNANLSQPQLTQIVDFTKIADHFAGNKMLAIFQLENSRLYCNLFMSQQINYFLDAFNSNISFNTLQMAYSEITNSDKFKEITGVAGVINSNFNITQSFVFQTLVGQTMRFKYDAEYAYGAFNFKGSQININIMQIQQISVSQIKTITTYDNQTNEIDNKRYGVFMLYACSANIHYFAIDADKIKIDMFKRTFNSSIQTDYTDTPLNKPPYYYINAFCLDLNTFSNLNLKTTMGTITLDNSVASGTTKNELWTANLLPFTYGKGGVFAYTPPQVTRSDSSSTPNPPPSPVVKYLGNGFYATRDGDKIRLSIRSKIKPHA